MNEITRGVPALYLPSCVLFGVLFIATLGFVDRGSGKGSGQRVSDIRWIVSDSLEPPEDDANWSLWAEWPQRVSTYPKRASVWYQIRMPLAPALEPDMADDVFAVYVPVPKGNVTLFIDEQMIASGGSRRPPVAHHTAPLLFRIPAASLSQPESNNVYIHRTHMDGAGSLPDVYVGPYSQFEADYRSQRVVRLWIPLAILVCTLLMTVVMAGLYWLRRHETLYGWYALMMVFWALYQGWNLTSAPWLSNPFAWRAISYASLGLFVSASVVFVHRFVDRRPLLFERALLWWSLAGVATLFGFAFIGSLLYVRFGLLVWIPVANALGIYTLVRLAIDSYAAPSTERLYLLAVVTVVVIAGLRDFLWDIDVGLPGTVYYVGYTAGLFLLVFALILMMRFSRALDAADHMQAHLSALVTQKTQQLEATHAKLQEAAEHRAVAEERERIMRDMHDGVGGQLVQAIALSERGDDADLEKALRYALADLRLIADSLSPSHEGLFELLAAYRHRVSQLVNRVDIEIAWDIDDAMQNLNIDSKTALNVLRIVQEAMTNAIQHSGCNTIRVSVSRQQDTVVLSIVDDGVGPSGESHGRGLKNMHVRADEIGASLDIDFSNSGTAVICRLAIPSHHEV